MKKDRFYLFVGDSHRRGSSLFWRKKKYGEFQTRFIIAIKRLIFIYSSVFALSSCTSSSCKNLDSDTCPVLKDFQVFDKNELTHFNHLCSDLDHDSEFARQSYVLFESSNTNEKALILAVLRLGWLGIGDSQGIAVDFLEIKINSMWPSALISFALEMKNKQTGGIIRGNFVNYYLKGPHAETSYQLDKNGSINWYNFLESEESAITESYNHPVPAPSITIDKLPNTTTAYQLFLIIKNNSTKGEIKLAGPSIENIEPILNIKKPQMRVLGLFDTLNPFQKGGLWDVVSVGAKYDKCIYARKKARKEFTETFNQL